MTGRQKGCESLQRIGKGEKCWEVKRSWGCYIARRNCLSMWNSAVRVVEASSTQGKGRAESNGRPATYASNSPRM